MGVTGQGQRRRGGQPHEGDAATTRSSAQGTIRADGRRSTRPSCSRSRRRPNPRIPGTYYKLPPPPRRGGLPAACRGRLPARPAEPAPEQNLRTETTRMDDSSASPRRPLLRAAAARPDQRRLLCDAVARPGGDLRPAQHHQLHPWRPVHDGRLLRLDAARPGPGSATGGRCSSRRSSSASPGSCWNGCSSASSTSSTTCMACC